jgi:hypothetical protein
VLQPQSDEEIRPVVEALRRLDPLLDILWNPKAIQVAPPGFNAFGVANVAAKYDGRWDVVRYDTPTALREGATHVVITHVTELDRSTAIPVMRAEGAYAPVGMWLVDYMQLWDRAQGRFAEEMLGRLWVDHEKASVIDAANESAANQEALEKIYSEHGDAYWNPLTSTGKTAGAPWLESKRPAGAK